MKICKISCLTNNFLEIKLFNHMGKFEKQNKIMSYIYFLKKLTFGCHIRATHPNFQTIIVELIKPLTIGYDKIFRENHF